MQTDKQQQDGTWEENILNALYYAFAASDAEGRVFFLNLVLENFYKRPSFLAKLYETVANVSSEAIFEVSEETWAWVEFWRQFSYADKEKYSDQIAQLQMLRTEDALSPESQGILLFKLACMEGARDNAQASAQLYEQAARIWPHFSWTFNNWGVNLSILGQREQAIEKYQQAIEIDPKYINAYNNWGISLGELGQYEFAIQQHQKVVTLDPNNSKAHYLWGLNLSKLGLLEQAIEKYKKAFELDEKNYTVPLKLGIAYYRLQQPAEAKKYFTIGLENCRDRSQRCELNKAIAFLGLERTEEATAHLQETVVAFKLANIVRKEFLSDLQLLATAPAPPAGVEEFMALAKRLFGQEE